MGVTIDIGIANVFSRQIILPLYYLHKKSQTPEFPVLKLDIRYFR